MELAKNSTRLIQQRWFWYNEKPAKTGNSITLQHLVGTTPLPPNRSTGRSCDVLPYQQRYVITFSDLLLICDSLLGLLLL